MYTKGGCKNLGFIIKQERFCFRVFLVATEIKKGKIFMILLQKKGKTDVVYCILLFTTFYIVCLIKAS
jgi:hypothetical protein